MLPTRVCIVINCSRLLFTHFPSLNNKTRKLLSSLSVTKHKPKQIKLKTGLGTFYAVWQKIKLFLLGSTRYISWRFLSIRPESPAISKDLYNAYRSIAWFLYNNTTSIRDLYAGTCQFLLQHGKFLSLTLKVHPREIILWRLGFCIILTTKIHTSLHKSDCKRDNNSAKNKNKQTKCFTNTRQQQKTYTILQYIKQNMRLLKPETSHKTTQTTSVQ